MYFVVPASSTNILSVSARVIDVPSVAPSIWTAAPETLSAVVIVLEVNIYSDQNGSRY